MASRKTTSSLVLFAGLMQVFTLTAACGGGDGANNTAGGAGGSTAGASTGATSNSGGSVDTGGTDGNGGTTGADGGTTNSQAGTDVGPPTPAPEFEGVDFEGLPLDPSAGCAGGFDTDKKSIALLVPSSHLIFIDAPEGYLRANTEVCSSADGTPLLASEVEHLAITGAAADEIAIFDLLAGDLGNSLLGSEGAMTLDLGAGNDRLIVRGTRGDDHMACAATTSVEASPLRIDLGSRAHSLHSTAVESIVVSLGPGNDSFDGSESSLRCNVPLEIYGGADADVLQGGSKNDVLNGGDGNDEIEMASSVDGADVVNGGADDDLVTYAKRSKDVAVHLCVATSPLGCPAGECTCAAESGEANERDTLINCEDADGGGGNDTLIGSAEANVLSGKDGNDRLEGLGGADQLYGDAGDDTLLGGLDADLLLGGSGKNDIDGGDGDDICFISTRDTKKACETPVEVQ